MAYSDGGGRFWNADLSTRAGARTAAGMGGVICFVLAGLAVLGIAVFGGLMATNDVERIAGMIFIGIEVVLFLIAGFRLRAGKGAFWGIAAALLLALEMVGKLVAVSIGGLIFNGIMMVVLVNGIRGAFALRNDTGFDPEDTGVFD